MKLIVLDEVDSTNTYLKQLCQEGVPYGTAVYSDNQKTGYGRRDKFWHSEKGCNISLSMALEPFEGDSLISLAAAAGVITSLKMYLPPKADIGLKWPNDILLNGKKICGISCEKIHTDKGYIIIGIGINVNNPSFPAELTQKATSIFLETGESFDLEIIEDAVRSHVRVMCHFLAVGASSQILKVVKDFCINLGQGVSIIGEAGIIAQGIAKDIAADGGIIISKEDGSDAIYYSGEISLR